MIIVSGLSGAGKTIVLHTLEDNGYYCIDNIPINLLPALATERQHIRNDMAVGIDIRNTFHRTDADHLKQIIDSLRAQKEPVTWLFLNCNNEVLIRRFNASRRKHPLTDAHTTLMDAITLERERLAPIVAQTDLQIDTSALSVYQLKEQVMDWLALRQQGKPGLLLESFGFKNGLPLNADFVFDVRFLNNPYWDLSLRPLSGRDLAVQHFLAQDEKTAWFLGDTSRFLQRWIAIAETHRSYLSIAVGCTGGQHRSVYIVEQLASQLKETFPQLQLRHRDLHSH